MHFTARLPTVAEFGLARVFFRCLFCLWNSFPSILGVNVPNRIYLNIWFARKMRLEFIRFALNFGFVSMRATHYCTINPFGVFFSMEMYSRLWLRANKSRFSPLTIAIVLDILRTSNGIRAVRMDWIRCFVYINTVHKGHVAFAAN